MSRRTSSVLFDIPGLVRDALKARPDLPNMRVDTGPVAGAREPNEWLAVSDPQVQRSFQTATGHRLGGMDEDGSIKITAFVATPGATDETVQATRDRMRAIVAGIEAAICVDPTLAGNVHWAYPSQIKESDQGIEPVGVVSCHTMTYEITVEFNTRFYPGEAT